MTIVIAEDELKFVFKLSAHTVTMEMDPVDRNVILVKQVDNRWNKPCTLTL